MIFLLLLIRDQSKWIHVDSLIVNNFTLSNEEHQEINLSGTANCLRRDNVYYLKIHKTGSSTLTTLLFRYVFRHGLKVVPVQWQVYPDSEIERGIVSQSQGKANNDSYNIFLEHSVFDENEVYKVLPKDTIKIATIREPLSRLKSSFNEFPLARDLRIASYEDPVLHFLKDPKLLDSVATMRKNTRYLLRNTMSLEFGLPESKQENITEITAFLDYIDKTFALVLIAEYMPESLVLLRRVMCWDIKDIVYIQQRVKNYKHKNTPYPVEIQRLHQQSNNADYMLYNHFLAKHKSLVKQQDGFQEELVVFNNINSQVTEFCDIVYTAIESRPYGGFRSVYAQRRNLTLHPDTWGETFTIDSLDCAIMKFETVKLRQIALASQLPKMCQGFVKSGYFSDEFCSDLDSEYNLPLEVFNYRKYYMGPLTW